ncbi:DUF4355 domain-containing protein [Clostridium perfringens]|nr:DUF4355 domain-containing protein [Clostridium perfringens]
MALINSHTDLKRRLYMENLQDQNTKETTEVTTDVETKEEVKKLEFTQEELDNLISKRLEREKKKAKAEREEAEKLAKMSEAEKQQALFEKKVKEFEDMKKKYELEKMELEVIKQLSSKNLPTQFSKYLLNEDAETSFNNIKEFEVEWQKAIEQAVDTRLKGKTPQVGVVTNTTITKEQFNKLGFLEKQKFATDYPEAYKSFMKF